MQNFIDVIKKKDGEGDREEKENVVDSVRYTITVKKKVIYIREERNLLFLDTQTTGPCSLK